MVTLSKVPSHCSHYYETTYNNAYQPKSAIQLGSEKIELLKKIQASRSKTSHTFPAHQPELDKSHYEMKSNYQSAFNEMEKSEEK